MAQDIRRVYLDNNATTRIHPDALEAMLPYLGEHYGNPSSGHWFGRSVRARIEDAREQVAALIGAQPSEVFFCSGGTESDNAAIKGVAWNHPRDGKRQVITSAVDHPAVLNTVRYLSENGYRLSVVGVDKYGMADIGAVDAALDSATAVVSVMHANNEVGTIQPVREIAQRAKARGALVHTDAIQSAGKIPVDVNDIMVDLLSISAHKIHGPKGVGALYVRKGVKIHPLITGGSHERGMRPGTENVSGIIGFGKACEIARKNLVKDSIRIKSLRDELQKRILETIPSVRLNGHPEKRLPGTLNIGIEGVEGDALPIQCDMHGIALSTGSACSSGSPEPSYVLLAMGIPATVVRGLLRFSFGRENTFEDIGYVMERLPKIVSAVRSVPPL